MVEFEPESPSELRDALVECASKNLTTELAGFRTKHRMGGWVHSGARISTKRMSKVLMYEPRDLTISVEAGLRFSELQKLVAQNGQMVALDPPFAQSASVGGVIASNGSGPLRRMYGTARDLVIGMRFATLGGRIADTGGMVVKNVAGLDMGKLLIGSFGTLAAIASVNFRLHSLPEAAETYLFPASELDTVLARRDALKESVLQPVAIDILSPAVAYRFGQRGHVLAVRVAGRDELLARYRKELGNAERLTGDAERAFWRAIQEMPQSFLEEHPDGVIARVSSTLSGVATLPKTAAGWFVARAATGVTYFYFASWAIAAPWWKKVEEAGVTAVMEFAPDDVRRSESLWNGGKTDAERGAFVMMEKVKRMFDPQQLLNPGRLYGRI